MGLQVIGRLKRDHTRDEHEGHWDTLDELYQRHKRRLVQEPELGLSLVLIPVTCGHGLKATLVLAKGYQEPELEARPRDHQKAAPTWAAFLCTDLTLTGPEHDLRHTAINNWRLQGHDYFRIMAATGHKTLNVIKHYNTVSKKELKVLVGEDW